MIILRENEWAQEMIKRNDLGKHPTTTLRCVARYYVDQGYSKKEVERKLEEFIIRCEFGASIPKWSDCIARSIAKAMRTPAVHIDCITITKPEMEKIDSLKGKQIRRFVFTLLCLAKYNMSVNPNCDYWIANTDNEIMSLANIVTSAKRQGMMYNVLREEGMLQFSKKVDSLGTKILFAEDGDVVMRISDFRNLGFQYLMYHGGPYFECSNCGIVTKYSNPDKTGGQKYCKKCAKEIRPH